MIYIWRLPAKVDEKGREMQERVKDDIVEALIQLFARYAHGRTHYAGYNDNIKESIGMEEAI